MHNITGSSATESNHLGFADHGNAHAVAMKGRLQCMLHAKKTN